MSAEDEYVHAPWTPPHAESLIAAALQLSEGVKAHATRLAELGNTNVPPDTEWEKANQGLRVLLQEYGEALFEYTGSFDPVSNVYPAQDGSEVAESERVVSHQKVVTVLQRTDYLITDEQLVRNAGIAAELKNSPRSTLEQVMEKVHSAVPEALYAISHASAAGWSALGNTEGIDPMVSVTLVMLADSPASVEEIGDLSNAFDLGQSPLLFSQVDEY